MGEFFKTEWDKKRIDVSPTICHKRKWGARAPSCTSSLGTNAAMSTNHSRNKHFSTIRKSTAQLFAYYDAQPAATRALFQNFPENLWPNSYADHGASFPEAHSRHLANLRNIWGLDHPAVQDASRQVAVRRNRVVKLATPDDLDLDF